MRPGTQVIVLAISCVSPVVCAAQTVQPTAATTADHDDESDYFDMLLAIKGGAGKDALEHRITSYTGITIGHSCCVEGKHPHEKGQTVTVDLGYDRVRGHGGFSTELATMWPVVRFPKPASGDANYLRIYAGPGGGFRVGAGDVGTAGGIDAALRFQKHL